MPAWRRFGYGLFSTIAIAIGGLMYNEVFVEALFPLVDSEGQFSTPVVWLNSLVPAILGALLLAVWIWVIVGSVQEERTVNRRRRM